MLRVTDNDPDDGMSEIELVPVGLQLEVRWRCGLTVFVCSVPRCVLV